MFSSDRQPNTSYAASEETFDLTGQPATSEII